VGQLFGAKAPTPSAKNTPDGRLTGRLTHLADLAISSRQKAAFLISAAALANAQAGLVTAPEPSGHTVLYTLRLLTPNDPMK
jgi:hypothetical protein